MPSRAILQEDRLKPQLVLRVVGLYHVVRVSLRICALSAFAATLCFQGCVKTPHSDPRVQYGEHMWTKLRADLLVAESRERVLLARYAELEQDTARAAQYYHQAWCADRGSVWLAEKRDALIARGELQVDARCYVRP